MKKYITEPLKNGCTIFAFITLFSYTLGIFLSTETEAFIPSLKSIYLFFFFSVILAYANMLLQLKAIPYIARILLHYAASALLIFLIFAIGGQLSESGAATFIIMLAYTFIYAVIAITVTIINSRRSRIKNSKDEYNSKFS